MKNSCLKTVDRTARLSGWLSCVDFVLWLRLWLTWSSFSWLSFSCFSNILLTFDFDSSLFVDEILLLLFVIYFVANSTSDLSDSSTNSLKLDFPLAAFITFADSLLNNFIKNYTQKETTLLYKLILLS